ncbi:MAG: hypothetical protein H0W70_10280 [Actinobacteria bacterium]|nr:hypothetical protein [Actinomycetota bacterium]
MLALTQPGLTMCGVVSYTPKRWARLSAGLTPKAVEKAVEELVASRYVIVDRDTEELFVRSFVKNDGVLRSPNLETSMWRAYGDIISPAIREAFLKGLPEGLRKPFPEPLTEPHVNGSRACADVLRPPLPNPSSVLPAKADDEDETLHREALKRLEQREREVGPVRNRDGWLKRAERNLHAELAARRDADERRRDARRHRAALMRADLEESGYEGEELAKELRFRLGDVRLADEVLAS